MRIKYDEFMEEGSELHHCVYANKYYEKDNSLIFSATIEGIRMETIEVSLSKMQIVQCRGKHNGISHYHDQIMQLMKDNICKISARMSA